MRVTVTIKGQPFTFASPHTDAAAVAVLRGLMARGWVMSSFADQLLRQTEDGRALSRGQLNWIHKLVYDAERRAKAKAPGTATGQSRKPGSHGGSRPGT